MKMERFVLSSLSVLNWKQLHLGKICSEEIIESDTRRPARDIEDK